MSRLTTQLVRPFAFALVVEILLAMSGCTMPVQGPTAPVEFIRERRSWVSGDTRSQPTRPDAPAAGVNPDAPAIPADASAPTYPPTAPSP